MDEDYEYLILLAYLEDTEKWTEPTLQDAICSVMDLVNTASDLTGIYTAGLMVDYWGDDPLVSFFVQHDKRWDTPEDADEFIMQLFTKTLQICQLQDEMWVLNDEERKYLDVES